MQALAPTVGLGVAALPAMGGRRGLGVDQRRVRGGLPRPRRRSGAAATGVRAHPGQHRHDRLRRCPRPRGPAIYAGSVIGSTAQRRFARFFSREDAKLLLVAGAAAGVAAIFKAPRRALFAIEVPYRGDVARRNVLPAMVAAAASYVAFAAIDGTTPILPIDGVGSFGWEEIGGALVVGVLCGAGAARSAPRCGSSAGAPSPARPW